MSMHRIAAIAVSLAAVLLLAGCAAKNPYLVGDAAVSSPCPDDMTYSCTEYLGKKMRCDCLSRDELREILEPGKQ